MTCFTVASGTPVSSLRLCQYAFVAVRSRVPPSFFLALSVLSFSRIHLIALRFTPSSPCQVSPSSLISVSSLQYFFSQAVSRWFLPPGLSPMIAMTLSLHFPPFLELVPSLCRVFWQHYHGRETWRATSADLSFITFEPQWKSYGNGIRIVVKYARLYYDACNGSFFRLFSYAINISYSISVAISVFILGTRTSVVSGFWG